MGGAAKKLKNVSAVLLATALGACFAGRAAAQPTDAEVRYRSALEDCGYCPELTSILNNLGALYYAAGRYAEARPALLKKALALRREAEAGPDAAALLPLLDNLALLYRDTADYGLPARQLAERARTIVELKSLSETLDGATTFAPISARSWNHSRCNSRSHHMAGPGSSLFASDSWGQAHPLVARNR